MGFLFSKLNNKINETSTFRSLFTFSFNLRASFSAICAASSFVAYAVLSLDSSSRSSGQFCRSSCLKQPSSTETFEQKPAFRPHLQLSDLLVLQFGKLLGELLFEVVSRFALRFRAVLFLVVQYLLLRAAFVYFAGEVSFAVFLFDVRFSQGELVVVFVPVDFLR